MVERNELTERLVFTAFAGRPAPATVVPKQSLGSCGHEDAAGFVGVARESLACDFIERYPDAITGFSPDAFLYYLPGIICAGLREGRRDLLAYDHIIRQIDRFNPPDSWDEYFIARYGALTPAECRALQQWVLWLSDTDGQYFSPSELERAFDTLGLISTIATAVPPAMAWYRSDRESDGRME